MKIKSPLANFTNVLGQIRDSADLYEDTLRTNESSTRAVLIDPVLRTLGWDTGNPFMVEVEKPIDQGRVDYALYDFNQEVQIIVEAKKLGTNLGNKEYFLSLVKYAFSAGVSDVFLTDGINWLHFTNFTPGIHEPSMRLSLQDSDLVEISAYLVQRLDAARYWPEEKDVDELSQNINQLESEISSIHLELAKIRKATPQTSVEDVDVVSGQVQQVKSGLTSLSEVGNATRTKPTDLMMPDETVVSVRTWTDVLTHSCKFAMERNPMIPIPYKDAAGRKVNLLSFNRPPRGITYFETEYQGQHVFVYTNYDSNNCIRNALHILREVPSDAAQIDPSVAYS
jgi:predicted type IV restriction endonuclease